MKKKRFCSAILSALMVVTSVAPQAAYAQEEEPVAAVQGLDEKDGSNEAEQDSPDTVTGDSIAENQIQANSILQPDETEAISENEEIPDTDLQAGAPGTADPEIAATATQAEDPSEHVHNYVIKYDDNYHWEECDCGETTYPMRHSLTEVIDAEATYTEAGLIHQECASCGYKTSYEEIPIGYLGTRFASISEAEPEIIGLIENTDVQNIGVKITCDWSVPDTCVLSAGVLNAVKESGKVLTIDCGSYYSWVFDGSKMPDVNAEINLGIHIWTKGDSEVTELIPAGVYCQVCDFSGTGAIPDGASITMSVRIGVENGEPIYLYFYNPETAKLEYVGTYTTFDNGDGSSIYATVSGMKQCGSYAVTSEMIPASDDVIYPEEHEHNYTVVYDENNHWEECSCGDVINTAAHTFEWVTTKEASESESGVKEYTCTVCGYVSATEEIPATGTMPGGTDSDIIASGVCGYNLEWVLTGDGTLTISGNGEMDDFVTHNTETNPPWYSERDSILSVVIENGVTNISNHAFWYCSNLESIEIPEGVTSIGDSAFRGCSSLGTIRIPEGVTSIAGLAFLGCSSLRSIEIPEGVTSIGADAFYGCSSLESIEIPDSVTSIDPYTFYGCSSLSSIIIPEGVTSIGNYAFRDCSSLRNIEIPDSVTTIGWYAFGGCSSLTSIEIPEGVTSIESCTFYDCSSLESIEISESVTNIGNHAFWYCSSLSNIEIIDAVTSIEVPERETGIGDYAFCGCSNLGSIEIPEGVTSIGEYSFRDCSSLTNIEIPDSVTSIGNYAFRDCISLNSIEIPDSVTSISDYTFNGCSSLTNIEIPDSVISIGYDAFNGCSSLESIEIPDSVTSIGGYTFSGCSNLSSIEIPENVTSIDAYTFNGCSSLESIEIPEGVTSIGYGAFSGCSSLGTIRIPEGVASIGNYTFYGCSSLESIEIPDSVTSIGNYAFRDCSSLTNIEIPEGVTSIGNYAFSGCSSLTSMKISEGVTSIGDSAFRGCSSLESIEIPEGVASIGNYTFYGCSSLESIEIPDSVTSIGNYAFCSCSSLESIEIPEGVTSVGDYAFRNCSSLIDVYYSSNEKEWKEIEIGLDNSYLTEATIHYNSTGTDNNPLYDGNLVIKTFTGWDEENKTASFDDGIDYCINEDTDLSFLDSLDELLGQKVLVVENRSEILTIKGIYPVEEVVGTVSQWGASNIILNGEQYPTLKDWSMNETLVDADTPVLCYIHEGTIVAVETPQEKTGILNGWKTTTSEITIDDETYIVVIDDLTFLNYLQIWMGQAIEYTFLGNKVLDIKFLDFSDSNTAKIERYDEETGEVYFSDGQSYFVSENLEESPSDYIGEWVIYIVRTTQDQGTHLTSLKPVKSEILVTMNIESKDVVYKDGQYSFDSKDFFDREDFEIPYTVTVQNRTNAPGVNDQLKEEPEFDITINNVEMVIQSGFNFGWLNDGEIQSIEKGTIIHAGESVTAEGYIKPDYWYSPEELTNTYNVFCTVDSSAGEDTGMDTITVTVNYTDAPTDTLVTAAAQALEGISDKITMQMDPSFFDQKTTNRIAEALLSIAIMAKAEPQDLEEVLTEDLFDQLFGDWKLKTGANTFDVPVQIAVKTVEYGELIFEFTMHLTSFNLNGSDYGLFGSIEYSVIGGRRMDEVPGHLRHQSTVGEIARADVTAFCNAAYELAEKEIEKAYDEVTGDGLDKIADIVFGQTIKDILEMANTSVSDILFKIITTAGTSVTVKCPVDIYLYDETGELEASIVNNQVEKGSDSVGLEVIGDTKVITIWDGTYNLKLVSNGTGEMDITVTEYAGTNNILRVVDFYDIPLGDNIEYSAEIQPELLANEYVLVDNQSEKITPDNDEIILEEPDSGDVGEHDHVYNEPVFHWSEDYQTCTAVFTCESGDDEQRIDCAVSTETTEPSCTEDGKTVYTATALFADKEYTDTQDETIPATGHTYKYTDNGDSTHTKACTAGDDTVTEPHIYQDGICTFCGAKEPEEHVHVYGTPEFKWSANYASCTAIFTCESGDDVQKIECTVSSEVTDPTCTEAGKTVYTATAAFADAEYTDIQEKVIPATGHTYAYTDNGDGTHTKACKAGDDSITEPHTYQDGTCTLCGAEEPIKHVHEYGSPEIKWSENYAACTMVFICKDGDDRQSIECEITDEVTNATCTENGKVIYTAKGSFAGKEYTDVKEVEIPAAGHVYGTPEFNWSRDYQSCTAVFTCGSCNDEQEVKCTITGNTTDPTCTEPGKTVYTATASFADKEYTDTREKAIPATGHTYKYTDNGDGTHTKACTAGDDTATEPHTYKDGICTFCRAEEPKEHVHEYGAPKIKWSEDYTACTMVFTCKEGDDQQSIECEVTDEVTNATCTENGKAVYTAKGTFAGKEYTDVKEVDIPAIGHSYGTPEFSWSEDHQNCTAIFVCGSCGDKQEMGCIVTGETTDPSCIKDGKVVYTATVSFADKEYTDTQVEAIPATGHTYEYTDNGNGTHTKVCTAGDDTVTEPHTYQDGTCTYCGAEEPEGHTHKYGEPEFTWSDDYSSCTATFTCAEGDDRQAVACKVTSVNNGDGTISYTAAVEFNGESYTTQQKVAIKEGSDEKPDAEKPAESGGKNNPDNPSDANKGTSANKAGEKSASNVQTGDGSNQLLWSVLLTSMIGAGVIIALFQRRYTK